MKKIKGITFIIVGLIVTFIISCESNTKSKNGEIKALISQQIPCNGDEESQQQQMDNDCIFNQNFEDGVLELIINFNNTCGSAYEDSIELRNNEISIFLSDTSSVHYRCMCNHQSIYEFEINDYDEVDVILFVDEYEHEDYSLKCDTTLTF